MSLFVLGNQLAEERDRARRAELLHDDLLDFLVGWFLDGDVDAREWLRALAVERAKHQLGERAA